MLKVGVIGCGKIAQVRHIPEYLDNPDCQLVALFDLNAERTNELAAKYKCKAYTSYEELLNDPEVEAVSICTNNATHAAISIAALKAHKHVLCEKPMAITLKECEDMVKAAKENGCYLMIGQNQRLAKAHEVGKKLIAELTDADENGIGIKYSCKETVEGKKKKEMVEHVERFPMDAVNSVRPHIEFE